jgi:hypothetical protein
MSNSIFAAQIFTNNSRDIVSISGASKPECVSQPTLFQSLAGKTSKQLALDKVPVCLYRFCFSAGRTTNLNQSPRLRTGIRSLIPQFAKSCIPPVPAYRFLPYFTLGPCDKEEYDERFAPEYFFYLSYYYCIRQLSNKRRLYERRPDHSTPAT